MRENYLGRTRLMVTPLGLGLAALGRPGYINLGHANDLDGEYAIDVMEARAHAVLDAAWEAGVRYFDAARSYGRAESFLASWLIKRRIAPPEVVVGSKWGYTYTADWQVEADVHEVKEHSLNVLQHQYSESNFLLGNHLDLYQIHSATLESGVLDDRTVIAQLAGIRDRGIVIGLTVSGPNQATVLERALDIHLGGKRVFDCVQITWNLLEPSVTPVVEAAHDAGMGVLVKEALANGRLTERNTDPAFALQLAFLRETAAAHHTTLDALALAAVLAQPWADVVLSGATTAEQMRSNVKALDVQVDEGTIQNLLEALAETPETYWNTRSNLEWN